MRRDEHINQMSQFFTRKTNYHRLLKSQRASTAIRTQEKEYVEAGVE